VWPELEPQIVLIPIAIEALVKEISLSLVLRSTTDQLLAHLDNLFMIILLSRLRAYIVLIVGVSMEVPIPYKIFIPYVV
jgi:hypothetical protein